MSRGLQFSMFHLQIGPIIQNRAMRTTIQNGPLKPRRLRTNLSTRRNILCPIRLPKSPRERSPTFHRLPTAPSWKSCTSWAKSTPRPTTNSSGSPSSVRTAQAKFSSFKRSNDALSDRRTLNPPPVLPLGASDTSATGCDGFTMIIHETWSCVK